MCIPVLLCDLQIARRQKFVGPFRQPPNVINFAFEATCSDQVFRNHRFDMYLGDNCIQIFHLGRYTTPNEKFEYCYPHSNVLFILTINIEKMHCFLRNVSVTSDEKHDVNQSQATLLMTLGFRRYIAEYTVASF